MEDTYKNITAIALQELLEKEDIILIDVRTHEKYNEGHIEESINIPLEDIATYKGDIDSVHYIICQQGSRSKEAAEILIKKGYIVVNVLGGMTDWQGEKIED